MLLIKPLYVEKYPLPRLWFSDMGVMMNVLTVFVGVDMQTLLGHK